MTDEERHKLAEYARVLWKLSEDASDIFKKLKEINDSIQETWEKVDGMLE